MSYCHTLTFCDSITIYINIITRCGHSEKLKPAWENLMESFAESSDVLVAQVNCQGDSRSLCSKFDVEGYPTMLYGDPSGDLEEYVGGRDFNSLTKFAMNIV